MILTMSLLFALSKRPALSVLRNNSNPMLKQTLLLALVGSAQSLPVLTTRSFNTGFAATVATPKPFYTSSTRLFSSAAVSTTDDEPATETEFPHFANVPDLDPSIKKALKNSGLTTMTEVQAKTWEAASAGKDVLARARTGTGKTVAFLLPAIQQLMSNPDLDPNSIHMLILSPTRELASQIHDQAQTLTSGRKDISSQVVFGGTPKDKDTRKFANQPPTILVATPGRLKDHLQTTRVKGGSFAHLLKKTSILVLDETDRYVLYYYSYWTMVKTTWISLTNLHNLLLPNRMLDMGFKKDVDEIINYIPKNRQTLLFSATVPDELRSVMAATMKKDFVTVDCIKEDSSHTNSQVEQAHVVVPSSTRMVTGTVEILLNLIEGKEQPVKLVVFFPTAHMVAFYAALFNNGLKIPVLELHSRKSQSFRTKTADKFRKDDQGILFTSDVSARGVDYPGVTNVVQVRSMFCDFLLMYVTSNDEFRLTLVGFQIGIADSRESYIHRLGRTGRAGKVGHGLLVLSDIEKRFLTELKGIDVPVDKDVQGMINSSPSEALMTRLDPVLEAIGNGRNSDLADSATSAYRSMIGFYNGKLGKLGIKGTDRLVAFANGFALVSEIVQLYFVSCLYNGVISL